jgi:[acyl-carrier-protein] S-malonyltransferase
MVRAFVFPGQGSQAVGMGRDLCAAFPAAREVFEEVDDALDQKLSTLMFQGEESDLLLTENSQPALMAVSMAVVRVLERDGNFTLVQKAKFVAGHSLGEITALAAVGSVALSDAARLLKRRGLAMQRAVPVGAGAMAALMGLDLAVAQEVASEAAGSEVCVAANDNAPGQVVVSGHRAAVERAIEIAKAKGGRRAIMLAVSAPFHCPLMQPAADEMASALEKLPLKRPSLPIVCNVTAEASSDPDVLRRLLVEQVTRLVRWRESVLWMKANGVDTLVELGASKVLSGLAKRIDKEMSALAAGTPAEIDALIKIL